MSAIKTDEQTETAPASQKVCYVVMVLGYWGRGETIAEAAQQCVKAGAKRNEKASLRLILGDPKPTVSNDGYLSRAPGSEMHYLGMGFRLGNLLEIQD